VRSRRASEGWRYVNQGWGGGMQGWMDCGPHGSTRRCRLMHFRVAAAATTLLFRGHFFSSWKPPVVQIHASSSRRQGVRRTPEGGRRGCGSWRLSTLQPRPRVLVDSAESGGAACASCRSRTRGQATVVFGDPVSIAWRVCRQWTLHVEYLRDCY